MAASLKGLPLAPRLVLSYLHEEKSRSGSIADPFTCSMADCAQALGINTRTVSRSLRQLQHAEVISFSPGKGRRPTTIQFTPTYLQPERLDQAGGDA